MTTTTAKDALGKAIGRMASGIYVITAGSGAEKQGMLGSWVMQASFEPATLTACIAKEREIMQLIEKTGKFVVNVLGEENSSLMGKFAKYRDDQFDGVDLYENDHGVVLKDTVAYLSCELKERWNGGDHDVILAEIVEGEMLSSDLKPWTHLRKNGFSY